MGESGKRSRPYWDDADNRSHKRRSDRESRRDDKGGDDLVVYRIICPAGIIGSVIGKNGKVINSIRQDSGAKVKVVDPFPGSKDRIIIIYCHARGREDIEVDAEFNECKPLCAAQDALLKVHAAIVNSSDLHRDSNIKMKDKEKEECHLLVPSSQAANIIGKAGASIKKIRNKTRTNLRVISKDVNDPAHSCALEFDNFVLISGESEAVKRALFAVSTIMIRFTAKESIPLDTSIPNAPPSIIIPSDVPLYPANGLYSSVAPGDPDRSVPSLLGSSHGADISGYGNSGSPWPVYSSALSLFSGFSGASRSEELSVKLLCPTSNIGRVIGKGGNAIRNIRQDTGAYIEIGDQKANYDECIITVISKESKDDVRSVAVEAVLLLQGKIHGEDGETATMRLLIPSKIIGCIIGKSGSIINEIRKRTKADILISKGKKPKCAHEDDELVEIRGYIGSVRDALVQVVLNLREDVLFKGRDGAHKSSASVEPLYGGGQALPLPSILRSMPSGASMNYDHRANTTSSLGLLSSSHYGYGSMSGGDAYGSISNSSALYSRFPPPSTLEMIIPANAVGKVMGKGGTNIENIRKISGAVIEVSDSRSSHGDRFFLISGTSEEKRAAENLIQAFIMST